MTLAVSCSHPGYSFVLLWLLPLQKTLPYTYEMSEMVIGFKRCSGNIRVFRHDLNPEHWQSCCVKRAFKAAVICICQQLIFLHRHARFTWFVDKQVAHLFFTSSWIFCTWKVSLEIFQMQRQIIAHQLRK